MCRRTTEMILDFSKNVMNKYVENEFSKYVKNLKDHV